MPAAPPLPTTITASTAGHVGHSNTVHDVVNAVYSSEFNVKAAPYGAVGDGVADDRAAIQAAVTAAGNAYAATGSPQTVRIPQGTFKVGAVNYISGDGSTQGITSIKLANGVNVTGPGTVKVAASAYGSGAWYRVFSSPDGVSTGTRLSNASITGITVDGNKANQIASQQCSNIELECAANVTIQDVKSINANGNGIMLQPTRRICGSWVARSSTPPASASSRRSSTG
jgi:polygalacturonase